MKGEGGIMLSAESILTRELERLKKLDEKYPNDEPEGYTSNWEGISNIVKCIATECTDGLAETSSVVDKIKLREFMHDYEQGKSYFEAPTEICKAVTYYGSCFLANILERLIRGDFHYFTMIDWWALREYCDFRKSPYSAVSATDNLKNSLESYNETWEEAYNSNPIKFRFLSYYIFDIPAGHCFSLHYAVEHFARTAKNIEYEILSDIADGIL